MSGFTQAGRIQLGARAAYFKQAINEKLINHTHYIKKYGDDMPEIV
jgi:xylulose-5-phosphate/fructose-6-phosphate phosphoketolase